MYYNKYLIQKRTVMQIHTHITELQFISSLAIKIHEIMHNIIIDFPSEKLC